MNPEGRNEKGRTRDSESRKASFDLPLEEKITFDSSGFSAPERTLTDLCPPSNRQVGLVNQRPLTNTPPFAVNKTRNCVVFESNSEALWGCADGTVSWNSHGIA